MSVKADVGTSEMRALAEAGEGGGMNIAAARMQQRAKFSIWYYLTVFAVILAVDSVLFSGTTAPPIAYSEFLDRVTSNRVERVVITQDQIYGLMKAPDAPATVAVFCRPLLSVRSLAISRPATAPSTPPMTAPVAFGARLPTPVSMRVTVPQS